MPLVVGSVLVSDRKVDKIKIMTTHFITAEIDLSAVKSTLAEEVHAELAKHGTPLRWAITSVDDNKQTAQVEAVVTVSSPSEVACAQS
jgi:hypothetical protein